MKNKEAGLKLTISDWMSIINLIVIVSGFFISYFAVEKIRLSFEATKNLREQTELTYLTAKIINDIRPKLEVSYIDYQYPQKFSKNFGILVTLKNNGQYHLIIKDIEFKPSKKEILTKSGRNLSLTDGVMDAEYSYGGHGIAPNAEGKLEITKGFIEEVDLTQFNGTLNIEIITDPVILDTFRSAFPNNYDFSKIEKLSSYKISQPIKPLFKNNLN